MSGGPTYLVRCAFVAELGCARATKVNVGMGGVGWRNGAVRLWVFAVVGNALRLRRNALGLVIGKVMLLLVKVLGCVLLCLRIVEVARLLEDVVLCTLDVMPLTRGLVCLEGTWRVGLRFRIGARSLSILRRLHRLLVWRLVLFRFLTYGGVVVMGILMGRPASALLRVLVLLSLVSRRLGSRMTLLTIDYVNVTDIGHFGKLIT